MRPAATLNAPMMMMREGAACHGMFAIYCILMGLNLLATEGWWMAW